MKKWPDILEAWNRADSAPVRAAATEVAIVARMESRERLQEANKALQLAIWERDGIREKFQAKIDSLNSEIEALNSHLIFERWSQWQSALSELRNKRIVERLESFYSQAKEMKTVRYRSNFSAIIRAKKVLLESLSLLREMRHKPLAQIHVFIEKVERKAKAIDFSTLEDATEEVSAFKFAEISAEPGVTVSQLATMAPGGKVVNHFDEKGNFALSRG